MLYSPAFRFPARKPTGAKLALNRSMSGAFEYACRYRTGRATWRSSISLSTVNFAAAISLGCVFRISCPPPGSNAGLWFFNRRPDVRCSLKSPSKRGDPLLIGWSGKGFVRATGCFRAALSAAGTSAPVSTRDWWIVGSVASGSTQPPTAPTAFVGPRSRCSTRRQAIFAPASYCSATRSWKAPFDTWV